MMAAPPPFCRSHFDGELATATADNATDNDNTNGNGVIHVEKRSCQDNNTIDNTSATDDSGEDEGIPKPDQMDGSFRVSSASTETTMAVTVLEDSIATGLGDDNEDNDGEGEEEEEEAPVNTQGDMTADAQADTNAIAQANTDAGASAQPDTEVNAQPDNGANDLSNMQSAAGIQADMKSAGDIHADNKPAADIQAADIPADTSMPSPTDNSADVPVVGLKKPPPPCTASRSTADATDAALTAPDPSATVTAELKKPPPSSSSSAKATLKIPPSAGMVNGLQNGRNSSDQKTPPREQAATTANAGLKCPPPTYANGTQLSSSLSELDCDFLDGAATVVAESEDPASLLGTIKPDPMTAAAEARKQFLSNVARAGIGSTDGRELDGSAHNDLDRKPAAKPTSTTRGGGVGRPRAIQINDRSSSEPVQQNGNSPTPRGGRGLRGRRTPQTAQDRDARRQQIKQRMESSSNHSTNSGTGRSTSPAQSRSRSPTVTEPGRAASAAAPVLSTAAIIAALPGNSIAAPGDNLAAPAFAAPGDNLATLPSRPATRARIVRPPAAAAAAKSAAANPNADAYEANNNSATSNLSDHSVKQRMRRENLPAEGTPASRRPGAYKEIPGRGLVRNETLRFSIMNSIQKKKESFRKLRNHQSFRRIFSTRGDNTFTASARMNSESIAEDRDYSMSHHEENLRQSKSIPSVLVNDTDDDKRSYLGDVSMRSLNAAGAGNVLCVARPVFEREASTLEALCIIPGDLAVAVALDEQLKLKERGNAEQRLEALRGVTTIEEESNDERRTSAVTTRPNGKRAKARRTLSNIAKTMSKPPSFAKRLVRQPQKMLNPRMLKKKLNPFRFSRRKRTSSSSQDDAREAADAMTHSMQFGPEPLRPSLAACGRSNAMRRNSW